MEMAGYSGTPLAKKLSLKDGQRVWWEHVPDGVRSEIEKSGLALELLSAAEAPIDAAHIFVTSRGALEDAVQRIMPLLASSGFIWISWPKKASKLPTDISEDTIRDVILPLGLVDVKVCAVDATWSGLKLMIRKERRSAIAT
jgi:hypothetical protein